jgi:hypothetical protein
LPLGGGGSYVLHDTGRLQSRLSFAVRGDEILVVDHGGTIQKVRGGTVEETDTAADRRAWAC